jgi:MFS family permease
MSATPKTSNAGWLFVIAAATIMLMTTGARQCTGLFVSALNTSTGFGIVKISFAMAIGQLMWGAVQPLFGMFADRHGPVGVVMIGALLIALGMATTPLVTSPSMLVLTIGILAASGAGAGSFSILLGASAQRLAPERRGMAAGVINAGGSMGQFVYARAAQTLIEQFGWIASMVTVGLSALLTIPLALVLKRPAAVAATVEAADRVAGSMQSMGSEIRGALSDRSFRLLAAGFFTCGFHIAFLVVHLPGEVALCGLPAKVAANALALIGLFNVVGSIGAGWLCSRMRLKVLLCAMYLSRAVLILIYLAAPHTTLVFYLFAAALGATWLATVPPTAGLVAKLFGARYFSTLFGIVLFAHQIGGFFGAWLGGLVFRAYGNYQWMWYADIVLALGAAIVNLPIREARLEPVAA